MPHIEKRTGNVVIRIVYDGAPEAGKTTNLRELVKVMPIQRRSEVVSPQTVGRRTEFFDWATFTGGYVDGRRLRCQLVSVPGQPSLLRRRRYLIDTADAVVFVADSRPEALDESRRAFALMREAVARRGGAIPAGVMLQANKQDLQGSLSPEALAEALGAADVPVLGAEAVRGTGVMQTFITAARLGTQRVKDLFGHQGVDVVGDPSSSADELLRELEGLEEELVAPSIAASREAEQTARPPHLPPFPAGDHVAEAHVWPLVEGRVIWSELLGGRARYSLVAAAWAPPDALQVQVEDQGVVRWVMHTREAWSFAEAGPAKLALITLVRRLRELEPYLPPGRALSLHHDGTSHRIWMVTEVLPTLEELPRDAAPVEAVRALARDLGRARLHLPPARAVGVRDGRAYVLSVPDDEGSEALAALLERVSG